MNAISLDGILDLLEKHHQRATYGAVASLLGRSPRSLMQGRKRDWRHSWIVNKDTGLPSEYPAGMVHPSIREREEVLDSAEDLRAWLENPSAPTKSKFAMRSRLKGAEALDVLRTPSQVAKVIVEEYGSGSSILGAEVVRTSIGGADGCAGGWICVERDTATGACAAALLPSTGHLFERARCLAMLTIDIPIGLTEAGARTCDQEARRLLRPMRSSSVFPAPVRAALDGTSYGDACARSEAACGKRMSQQAYAIMGRIKEVDSFLRNEPQLQSRVREIHPEVCFAAWSGTPMSHRKSKVEGRAERLKLVNRHFPGAFERLRPLWRKSEVADDDLLDAFAALWTAERIVNGTARTIPEDPPEDRWGLRMEMVV